MHLYPNYNLNERKQLILFYTLISYNGQYPTPNNFLDLYHAAALDTTHLEIQYIIYQNELKLLGFFNAADELYTIIDKIKNYPKEITTYAQNFELPSF